MKSKRFPTGTGGRRRPDRIEQKRADAKERNETWAAMSTADQLRNLDNRLGRGLGAQRQRARLAKVAA